MRFTVLLSVTLFIAGCGGDERTKGDKLFASKNYEEAITAYSIYLDLHPTHIKSLYNRGRSFEELKIFDKAHDDFEAVLAIDKKNTAALLSLSKYNYRLDKFDRAKYYAELAIKHNDQLAQGYFWLGRAHHQMGVFAEAMKSYNNAINLDREYGEAYLYRGAVKVGLKRVKSACADFRSAEELGVKEAKIAIQNYCK